MRPSCRRLNIKKPRNIVKWHPNTELRNSKFRLVIKQLPPTALLMGRSVKI